MYKVNIKISKHITTFIIIPIVDIYIYIYNYILIKRMNREDIFSDTEGCYN